MLRTLVSAGLKVPVAVARSGAERSRELADDATRRTLALAADGLSGPLAHAERTLLSALDALLASDLAEEAARRIVVSDVVEHAVEDAFEGPLVDAVTRRLLASEELWRIVEQVAQSPAVTEAITRQGASFADEVAGEVREHSEHADAWLERAARRMLRRGSPAGPLSPTPPGLGPA